MGCKCGVLLGSEEGFFAEPERARGLMSARGIVFFHFTGRRVPADGHLKRVANSLSPILPESRIVEDGKTGIPGHKEPASARLACTGHIGRASGGVDACGVGRTDRQCVAETSASRHRGIRLVRLGTGLRRRLVEHGEARRPGQVFGAEPETPSCALDDRCGADTERGAGDRVTSNFLR